MYSPAQTTTLLGGERERGEVKADHVNCPKSFVLVVVTIHQRGIRTRFIE